MCTKYTTIKTKIKKNASNCYFSGCVLFQHQRSNAVIKCCLLFQNFWLQVVIKAEWEQLFTEAPLLQQHGSSSCCRSSEPADKRVDPIHFLINMEPHFLHLRALRENAIHQALSPSKRFPFAPGATLSAAFPHRLRPIPHLPLPVILHPVDNKLTHWARAEAALICPPKIVMLTDKSKK